MLPLMTYGAETWCLNKQLESKLMSAQWAMQRIVVGVTLKDRTRGSFISEQTIVEDIIVHIKKRMGLVWP